MHERPNRIHVVAPSGPVPHDRLDRGLSALRRHTSLTGGVPEIVEAPNVRTRDGFFAGPDAARLEGLETAWRDPASAGIWCARGGYGATRLLPRLDPELVRAREQAAPLVGFSDVTALHCWAYATAGARGVHGPVLAQLGELPDADVDLVIDLLRGEVPPPLEADEDPSVLCGGTVEGPLVVGNLEVLRAMVGTPWMPSLDGALLGIEDVGERPYRIDRALTQLLTSGSLRGVRGVVVGQLHGCVEPDHGSSQGADATTVIAERLGRLGVPVVTGFPFGHAPGRNAALPFGAPVRLHADDATLEFLEPVLRG